MNFNNKPIDWSQVNAVILSCNKIILTTHENPDGDGLGAEIGLYYHLKDLGKDVRIINYSPLPKEYDYLNTNSVFESYLEEHHDEWLKDADLAIIFDVGDYSRTRKVKDAIEKYNISTMNIDHHPHPDNNPFTYNLVDLSAAATGCMVYDYLKVARDSPIEKNSLLGIYTAVMTDTGCFKYSNTDKKCHEIAIESIQNGIETNAIYQNIYENSSRPRMKLLGDFLSNLHYELDGQFAWFAISQEMLKSANANKSDVEGFTDIVRSISGVEVAVMIFEKMENECRVNFRSKGKYKINDIAKSIGGGGHAFASGAMINGSLNDAIRKVVSSTKNNLKDKMNFSEIE
ncbi:MAG: DHH family phosphoesterase [Candidatus Marinimicrobia bacterium]|nr:DHH family phosphoesterase [Candidatus Neomarinimicrobiota bacterium]